MSDIFDQASEREDRDRQAAIDRQRRASERLPYVGCCYYCGSITPTGVRFCDADCRDDYQEQQRRMKMAGR